MCIHEVHSSQAVVPLLGQLGDNCLQEWLDREELHLTREIKHKICPLPLQRLQLLLQPVDIFRQILNCIQLRTIRAQPQLLLHHLQAHQVLNVDCGLVSAGIIGRVEVHDRHLSFQRPQILLHPAAVRRLATPRWANHQLAERHGCLKLEIKRFLRTSPSRSLKQNNSAIAVRCTSQLVGFAPDVDISNSATLRRTVTPFCFTRYHTSDNVYFLPRLCGDP
mmetsp:Transcript_15829/g.28103  ORF Transcript_15829/g.28103 Transcript_15829/m.28103 type:complete len:221 (+) Transcript_15829:1774-2436(+)